MTRERKPVHKVEMTDGKRDIIRQLLQEYDSSLQKTFRMRSSGRRHQRNDGSGNG